MMNTGYERLICLINNFEGFSWDIFSNVQQEVLTIIIHIEDLIFNQFIGNEALCFTLIFKVCYGWFGPAQIGSIIFCCNNWIIAALFFSWFSLL